MASEQLDSTAAAANRLMRAIRSNDLEKLKEMLATCDINAGRDRTGHSPLQKTFHTAPFDMVRFLLESGADPNVQTRGDGNAPLHMLAAWDWHFDKLKLFVEHGADVNVKTYETGTTPLDVAYRARNHEQNVKYREKCDVDNRDAMIQFLLDHGAVHGDSWDESEAE